MKKLISLLFCSLFLVSTANAEISLSMSSDSWNLDSISLCETVVSEEAINIVNLSFSHSSITEYRPEELALNIFPNPANSSITIEVKKDKGKVASVEIFNALGEKVLEFERNIILLK